MTESLIIDKPEDINADGSSPGLDIEIKLDEVGSLSDTVFKEEIEAKVYLLLSTTIQHQNLNIDIFYLHLVFTLKYDLHISMLICL